MGEPLREYAAKRDFTKTSEPAGEAEPSDGAPVFVVQRHDASRLHYDFRLEHGGVLWSWAVPKGPSADPKDKRLAVRTEDHPLSYATFEGVIPSGQYGGGPVQLWDTGTWAPLNDPDEGMERGRLRFELNGERLKGRWTLVKTKRGDWLLIKGRDAHAVDGGPPLVDRFTTSVETGRTVEAIQRGSGRPDPAEIEGARRRARVDVKPQLATRIDAPPRGDAWIHELKLDGYRVLARLDRGEVKLTTRKGLDWTAKAPSIAAALAKLDVDDAWIDGELVVFGADGTTDFGALQRALSEGRADALRYVAFDLLTLDGFDLRGARLDARRALLATVIGEGMDPLRFSEAFEDGAALHREACALGAEGVVSKRRDAIYEGKRTRSWRKARCSAELTRPIVGFTEPSGARVGLGALVLGRWDEGALRYAGKVGTGFDRATLKRLRAQLEPLETDAPPVEDAPRLKGVRWVSPTLSARVKAKEETRAGRLRHPVFVALEEREAPRVTLTNPDRVLFDGVGLEKRELAAYYEAVAPRMLPRVAGRPLMLVRAPRGIDGPRFHQKHRMQGAPDALRAADVGDDEPHVRVDDVEGLRALAQISALEIHVWGARADAVEQPERIVIDLDPDEAVGFDAVLGAAHDVRGMLEGLGLTAFCLATGGKGLHVVAPLLPSAGWRRTKTFCKAVAESLVQEHPDRYVATSSKRARRGKIFVDYLRNGRGATAIAPYSTRARADAPVALPVAWDDLERGPRRGLLEALESLERPDPWDGYDAARRPLP